jgi:hypothetical protein
MAVTRKPKVVRRGTTMTAQTRVAARTAVERRVNQFDCRLMPVIRELERARVRGLRRIACALEERGIPAPRGGLKWSTSQVARLLARLEYSVGNKRAKLRAPVQSGRNNMRPAVP